MSGRLWSNEELHYVEKHWGRLPTPQIAKNLKRGIFAVKRQATLMGLGHKRDYEGLISVTILYKSLHGGSQPCNKSRNAMLRKGIPFKAYYIGGNTTDKVTWMVDIDVFWKWFEKNQDAFDSTRVEKNILGEEPKWFKEKRRLAFKKLRDERWKEFGGCNNDC